MICGSVSAELGRQSHMPCTALHPIRAIPSTGLSLELMSRTSYSSREYIHHHEQQHVPVLLAESSTKSLPFNLELA